MLKNEIVQLKSYDDKTGQEIGNVLPITNSEAVKVDNDKNLKQTLVDMNDKIEQTNSSLDNKANVSDLQEQKNRIDNIVSNSTETTEGNIELIDGRIGDNGVSFGTIGNHIRSIEKGYMKNIDAFSFSPKAFKNEILEQLSISATSGVYSEQIHATVSVSIPLSTGVKKIHSHIEYESNSSYIESIQQRITLGSTVQCGIVTTDTVGELQETFTFQTLQNVNSVTLYFWVGCSEVNKDVKYKIKKWNIVINDNISYDIVNKINNGFSLDFPFGARGTKTKETLKKAGLPSKKDLNFLSNYKKYLLGIDDYKFVNGKNVNISKPFETGSNVFGFAKATIPFSSLKDVTSVRLKGKFLSFHNVFDFTTLIELVDSDNTVTTLSGERYYPNQGYIYDFDYTYYPTKKNNNIKTLGIYLRTNVLENEPFTFDFGNIEIYVNNELIDIKTWGNAFSQGTITDINYLPSFSDLNNIQSNISSPLKGKTIMFFGDSIMDTYTHTTRTPYWVCNLTGAIQKNYAVSSSGFCMNAAYNHAKWGTENTNVPAMIERSVIDGIIPDYIVIAASTNDWDFQRKPFGTFADSIKESPTIDTFYGALGLTIKTVLKHYPLSKILFVTPLPRKQVKGSGTQHTVKPNGKTVIDYAKAIIEVCNHFSMKCLHLTESSGFNLDSDIALELFMKDGLHPTERGAKERHAPPIIKTLEEM